MYSGDCGKPSEEACHHTKSTVLGCSNQIFDTVCIIALLILLMFLLDQVGQRKSNKFCKKSVELSTWSVTFKCNKRSFLMFAGENHQRKHPTIPNLLCLYIAAYLSKESKKYVGSLIANSTCFLKAKLAQSWLFLVLCFGLYEPIAWQAYFYMLLWTYVMCCFTFLQVSFLLGLFPVLIAWIYSEILEYKKSLSHGKV